MIRLLRLPVMTWIALAGFVVAIVLAELGWRADADARGAPMPVPRIAVGLVGELRSIPVTAIADPRSGAIAAGVIFGRTDHVAGEDEQAFLASGLWHLLAASGQNVALVAACCILLARGFGGGRVAGSVLALAAIPAYVLVVGGGSSIVRAGIMGELAIVAWLSGRLADMRHVLVVAATIIVWAWPGVHRSLGMQLSFACVAVLAWRAAPYTRWLMDRGVPAWLAGSVVASLLCSLATAPILTLRTGAAPMTGIVANVVAVPLAGLLLVAGLAGTLAAAAIQQGTGTDVAGVLLAPAGLLAAMLRDIASRAADLPAAQVAGAPLLTGALPVAALVLCARPPRSRRGTHGWACVFVTLATVGCILASPLGGQLPGAGSIRPHPIATGDLRIGVLDVGQGDATLLGTRDGAVLVDTGPPDGRVVDRVRELGVRRVEGIVLTHDSLDHRGGFDAAYGALRPRWVAMPRGAPGPWRRIHEQAGDLVELCAGDAFGVGDAVVDVLQPRCDGVVAPKTGDLHNDGAMVLLVRHGRTRALLPADAESPSLLELPIPRLQLLRVAHHGSEDPRLPELLARTAPDVAAISSGAGNEYGHPRAPTLAALRAGHVRTLRTDRDGTIVLDSDGRGLTLRR